MSDRTLPPYHCPVCGRYGTEDDLCALGEPCPDEECDGTIRLSRDGYMGILHDLHVAAQEALLHAFREPATITYTADQVAVLMTALNTTIESIAYRGATPWGDT